MTDIKTLLGEDLHTQVTSKLGEGSLVLVEKGMKAFLHKDSDEPIITNNGDWIPKLKFNQKLDTIKSLETNISDYQKQVDNLNKSKGNLDELNTKIGELNTTITDNQKNADKTELNIRKKYALLNQLALAGAKHPELLSPNFKTDDFELNDKDEIKDFDKLLEPVKKKYEDQFGKTKIKGVEPDDSQEGVPADFITYEKFLTMSPKERAGNIKKINESSPFWIKK